MIDGTDEDIVASAPENFTQYYVCGTRIDYDGTAKNSDTSIRFYNSNGSTWHANAVYATRCTESMALEYLSTKQNLAGLERQKNFFIVRADVTLTRVKVKLEDL